MEIITNSTSQTKKTGELLAEEILKISRQSGIPPRQGGAGKNNKTAFIVGLQGDLGGGKTCFLQGFAKGLGIKEKITSPTFVIMKKFKINHLTVKPHAYRQAGFSHFYHIDCYRIKDPREISGIGFKEIISNPQNIVAIEWVEKIKKILPKDTLILKFDFINRNTRKIKTCDRIIKMKK